MINTRKSNKGATLIEILIVFSVLAILASIAIPKYSNYVSGSEEQLMVANLKSSMSVLERHRYANNSYINAKIFGSPCDGKTINYPIKSNNKQATYTISCTVTANAFSINVEAQNNHAKKRKCQSFSVNQLGRVIKSNNQQECEKLFN